MMTIENLLRWLRRKIRLFIKSDQGMTLPLMGFALVSLAGFVGIGIDTARMQMVQSKLQFSVDAAGLAASSTVNTAGLNSETAKYLNTDFNNYLGATLTGSSVVADSTNTVFTLSATATLPTTFMQVLGVKQITVTANSQITRAITGLELVLVLDNTGSMNESAGGSVSKIQALQNASTTLINTLFSSTAASSSSGKLWIGIVPFSQAVNIGTSHPAWINSAYTYDGTTIPLDWGPGGSWGGCVDARLNGEDVIDDPPSQTNPNTLFGQYYWTSDNLNTDGIGNSGYNQWKIKHINHGVTTYSYASPLNSSIQGPNFLCPQQVLPMTNDKATLLSTIGLMKAQGNTLINQGLAWGWNMISPRWQGLWGGTMNANGLPLAYHTKGMIKAIVLLTDGYNTIDNGAHSAYWFLGSGKTGSTNGSTAIDKLNQKTATLCTAMKAQGIYIYTIGLGTGLNSTSVNLLQNCATAVNYAFLSPSTSQLQNIFSTIGDSLSNLRVSK